ncbi:MAG: hypothetical protein EOP84_23995 [Verrucomicrobiaceae bacterium]|nr:MAG: hypothetical protein EOP84_23995 [Verrucomicrobiaceae bacterium]
MRPLIILLCLLVSVSSATGANEKMQSEIDYLLKYVEATKGQFIRSGKEYSGKEAAAHLRSKLSKAGDRIKSTEDFVNGIASKSYLTGSVYKIKLPDGSIQPSGPWLMKALAERRRVATPQ